MEIIDVLNEGFTQNINQSIPEKEKEVDNQNIDEIIQKIENSILDLKIYLSKLEIFDKNQLEIPLPNRKSILHNRGPESGIYINSVKFDKEEDNFGLEEELSFKTHEYNNNDKSTVLPHFINSETHTSY